MIFPSKKKKEELNYIEAAVMNEAYLAGYRNALEDFGIWKDGVQRVGCLETPIKEAYEKKRAQMEKEIERCSCHGFLKHRCPSA